MNVGENCLQIIMAVRPETLQLSLVAYPGFLCT
jgi:hypothetical protein